MSDRDRAQPRPPVYSAPASVLPLFQGPVTLPRIKGDKLSQRYSSALVRVEMFDPLAEAAIREYVAELRAECARWRVQVRALRGDGAVIEDSDE